MTTRQAQGYFGMDMPRLFPVLVLFGLSTMPAAVRAQSWDGAGQRAECNRINSSRAAMEQRYPSPRLAPRPRFAITGTVGGYLAGEFNAGLGGETTIIPGTSRVPASWTRAVGGSYTLQARADVMLLHPLWLTASARWYGAGAFMFDAVAGFNFRRHGMVFTTHYFRDYSYRVSVSYSCTLEHADTHIVAGAKAVVFTGTANSPVQPDSFMALQLGVGRRVELDRGGYSWGVQALFDPVHLNPGIQGQSFLRGLVGPPWLGWGMEGGWIYRAGVWVTLDVGVSFTL